MKTLISRLLLAVAAIVALPLFALAQDTGAAPAAPPTVDFVTTFITGLATSHPWIVTLVAVMGALRLVAKPIVGAIEAYVKSTPSKADDEFIIKAEASTVFKVFCWLLDYLGSVKIGTQFVAVPEGQPPANPPQN